MSTPFKERFKSKLSVIGKMGLIITNKDKEIEIPGEKKIHNAQIPSSSTIFQVENKAKDVSNSRDKIQSVLPSILGYIPYTLSEYKIIKPTSYYELGGLGAYNIGTKE